MNKLSPTQAEQIKEIGTYLRQKRLEKSLTIEDIASLTMIRLQMLQALEEGALDRLPELIYVKGFVRRYAEALKMDGQTLANSLFQIAETPAAEPLTLQNTRPTAVQTVSSPPPPPKERENNSPTITKNPQTTTVTPSPKPSNRPINPYWIYSLLGIGGVLCGLWYFLSRSPEPETISQTPSSPSSVAMTTPKPSPTVETAVTPLPLPTAETSVTPLPSPTVETAVTPLPSPTAETSVTPLPSPTVETSVTPVPSPTLQETQTTVTSSPTPVNSVASPSPSPTAQESPLSVSVKLEDNSWLQVVVDGKTEYIGILETGEQKTWTANKSMSIRAGNAGAVKLSVNQQPAQSIGKVGEVKEITLTPTQ